MKGLSRERFDLVWVLLAVCLTAALAFQTWKLRETWPGLPLATSESAALLYGYGDKQLSYRNIGLMLQNAGDTGGRVTNFKDYNYQTVEDWLWLTDKLDSQANYVPGLAAFYFGAAKEPKQLSHLVDYLAHVGMDNRNERWRWLAHAIFLTRFKLEDQPRALDLANKLASISNPDMPAWTKVMPAYVMNTMGEKKEARDLLLLIMADPKALTDRADVNQSCWYINKNLREPGDGLDQNEIFKTLCTAYLEEDAKREKEFKARKKAEEARERLSGKDKKVVAPEAAPEEIAPLTVSPQAH